MTTSRPKVLWGITGSVAAIRADRVWEALEPFADVRAIVTRRGRHFLPKLPASLLLHDDASEWSMWSKLGDPVLHIELRRWADVLLIAPLSADALAKLSTGVCDTLLLSVARAWDFTKPVLVAPAMNTKMWEHPVTAEHLERLRQWGVGVIEPVEKELACADVGIGAMAEAKAIVAAVADVIPPSGSTEPSREPPVSSV